MNGLSGNGSATSALMNATQAQVALATQRAKSAQGLDSAEVKKAEGAAKEFEAVFVSEMLKPMFEGLDTDGAFGGGKGEEIFRGMMLDEYGKMIAENGNIGLADQVKQHMILMQEQANGGT